MVISSFIHMNGLSLCNNNVLGHESPEYQVFLNDLPGNDFNTIFKSLPSFQKKLSYQLGPGAGSCLFSRTPSSFYGRLFPSKTLHFVHSSYSLHWLSQGTFTWQVQPQHVYLGRTTSNFQKAFSMFLKCRAEELVAGGRMVLTFLGRRSEDPSSEECCYVWELLALALNDMVSEGLIEEDKMDSFNIPNYTPSPSEVEFEVLKGGYFSIDRLEVSEVFRRYKEITDDRMSKEKTQFINVTISVTKRE
ncbi:S-adenosyl-L-methionine:benzoic acid/salicylic acid carboxyl methyltransferase 3-like [Fagus crenata]